MRRLFVFHNLELIEQAAASFIVDQSDWLPMIIPTFEIAAFTCIIIEMILRENSTTYHRTG